MVYFPEGHEFIDPQTGQGYRLTEAITSVSRVTPAIFKPIDGAPKPIEGEIMPNFLIEQLRSK